jgi:hypothetical protein
LIVLNLLLKLLPRPLTTVMIAIEMPAAMRPYSMAVAPDSSAKNCLKMLFKFASGGALERPNNWKIDC